MTRVYVSVHNDGSFSWLDPRDGSRVENVTSIPNRIWEMVPAEERERIGRRREMLRATCKRHPSIKPGLKDAQIQRMMAERRREMRK